MVSSLNKECTDDWYKWWDDLPVDDDGNKDFPGDFYEIFYAGWLKGKKQHGHQE